MYIFRRMCSTLEMYSDLVYILPSTPTRSTNVTSRKTPSADQPLVDPWVAAKYIMCTPWAASHLLHVKTTVAVSYPTALRWFDTPRISMVGPFATSSTYGKWGRKITLARSISAATFGYVKVSDILARDHEVMYVVSPRKVAQPKIMDRVHPDWRERLAPVLRDVIRYIRKVSSSSFDEAVALTAYRIGASEATLRGFLQCRTELTMEQAHKLHQLTGVPYYVPANVVLATSWRARQDEIIERINPTMDSPDDD